MIYRLSPFARPTMWLDRVSAAKLRESKALYQGRRHSIFVFLRFRNIYQIQYTFMMFKKFPNIVRIESTDVALNLDVDNIRGMVI